MAKLPAFIIGGAPRSGTTFALHALDRHPRIYMAKPFKPEPKVFLGPEKDPAAAYTPYFKDAPEGKILGEKSTNYFESADACRRMRKVLPDVRLIFILREPAARAYSNYLWSKKNGLETLAFEEVLRSDEDERTRALPPEKARARPFHYLSRGRYDVFAEEYLNAFGPEQVRFFLYEDLRDDFTRVMKEMQTFIGVDPIAQEKVSTKEAVNSAKEQGAPLDPALEEVLRGRLRDSVLRLRRLTGLDLGPWRYV